MDARTPLRNLGGTGLRLVELAVRYTVIFVVTWVTVDVSLSVEFLDEWSGLFLLMWVPSIVISFVYGQVNTRTGVAFRAPLAGLLMLPLWFLLPFPPALPHVVTGQLLFALCVIRAPMVGPSHLRPRERAALAAAARLAHRLASRVRRTAP